MKNSKTLFQDFVNRITLPESQDEIKSIAYLVFENLFGLSKAQILSEKGIAHHVLKSKLEEIINRINNYEPIQYILGEAYFYGRNFFVNPSVLIPRPETEELVRVVIDYVHQNNIIKARITDVGTGSGCIPITLSLELHEAEVFATDISGEALKLASRNARIMRANVQFIKHDILRSPLPSASDIIVSNPPYIAWNERNSMPKNVIEFEPEIALFVDSNDPLKFYKALIEKAKKSLTLNGLLAVEINERFGEEVQQLFQDCTFKDIQVLQDVFGKDRIVKGILYS